jgi:endo-1,3-1,4-beta-glycanase ExoK
MTIDHRATHCAAIALAAMAGAAVAADGQAAGFVEKFDTLDRARWFVSDGWSNGDYAVNDWRASQVRADRGLTLMLARNPAVAKGFSSGEVQSKTTYLHGYYEARFRAAPGSGVVTGFFTYTGPAFKTVWNEIDVEIIGRPAFLRRNEGGACLRLRMAGGGAALVRRWAAGPRIRSA